MYSLPIEVVKGIEIVTALQNHPSMPGVSDLFVELDYLSECILDSERFYGVPFRHVKNDVAHSTKDRFDAVPDIKGHLEEFYFNGEQELLFGFRPRAYYRLLVEPLLDSMSHMSHDDILDCAPAVVEQIKERILINELQNRIDSVTAYRMYRDMTVEAQKNKKVKEITAGVMKLRKKTLALQAEIKRSK